MDFLRHLFAYISLFCVVICWNLTNMVTNNKRWQIRLPLLEFSTLTEDLKSILDEQFSSSVTRWRESSIGEQSCFGEKSKAEQPPKTAVNHETWNPSNYAPPEPQLLPSFKPSHVETTNVVKLSRSHPCWQRGVGDVWWWRGPVALSVSPKWVVSSADGLPSAQPPLSPLYKSHINSRHRGAHVTAVALNSDNNHRLFNANLSINCPAFTF